VVGEVTVRVSGGEGKIKGLWEGKKVEMLVEGRTGGEMPPSIHVKV